MKKILSIIILFSSTLLSQNFDFNSFSLKRQIERIDKNSEISSVNLTYSIYDKNEKLLYSITKVSEYDLPYPGGVVFGDGSLMIIDAFDTSLEFYNKAGNLLSKTNAIENAEPVYERVIYTDASGQLAVLGITDPNLNESKIIIYESGSSLINDWATEFKHINGIKISSDLNMLALSVFNWTESGIAPAANFYNFDGEILFTAPHNFIAGEFSGNSFLGFTNKSLFVYDLQTGTVVWNFSASADEMILDAAFNAKETQIITANVPQLRSGKWYYPNLKFLQFSESGKMVNEKLLKVSNYNVAEFSKSDGAVKVLVDGRVILAD